MEDGRRRTYIKQQAATRKNEGTGTSNPSTKRKPVDKIDRPPKKPKVMVGSIGLLLQRQSCLPHPFMGKVRA